jgi:hypothetical protein
MIWRREEFVNYLETTLIPDLKESGHVNTAEDFETAVEFINNPDVSEVDTESF